MLHIIGLGLLIIWSLGFIAPYTIFGFIEILLITFFLNYFLKKINVLVFYKTGHIKKSVLKTMG